ncbi:MAG TPA: cytochrome c peroxidase [Mucilaginibacter sp.]
MAISVLYHTLAENHVHRMICYVYCSEGSLYATTPAQNRDYPSHHLIGRNGLMARNAQYRVFFKNVDILSWQVFDAAKLEIFRILTLGITGFDVPLALSSIRETAASLTSLRAVIESYPVNGQLPARVSKAIGYLNQHPEFNEFNRAAFIINYGNLISTGINQAKQQLNIPLIKYNRLLNQEANTLFDRDAFYVNAYAPSPEFFVTAGKTALGKKLFSDPALSGNQTRSCASCHQPGLTFTDGLKTNTAIFDHVPLPRNTPTLLNAGLQAAQFYDLRALTLEDQIRDVIENKKEMHGDMNTIVKRLWKDSTYRKLFSNTFPKPGRTAIDSVEVMNVLSSFLRSLTKLNSRFDDYMRGKKTAMDAEEISGFNLFMGKAKCATCHYMPLFNGTVPPIYLKTESEVIGVPGHAGSREIDADLGRYNIIPIAAFKNAFKTPTVRNAALTAPYMHNGVFKDLNEVVDFYNKGGGMGAGIAIDNQTLSSDKLNLSPKEVNELIAFIKSLNSN